MWTEEGYKKMISEKISNYNEARKRALKRKRKKQKRKFKGGEE